ncbi:hypothetical protein ABW19_dt0203343 [Dactylella cylindrospora]|nr:hypothetical protein ABW19_dt0203343 [Dactylella cylindrospora]
MVRKKALAATPATTTAATTSTAANALTAADVAQLFLDFERKKTTKPKIVEGAMEAMISQCEYITRLEEELRRIKEVKGKEKDQRRDKEETEPDIVSGNPAEDTPKVEMKAGPTSTPMMLKTRSKRPLKDGEGESSEKTKEETKKRRKIEATISGAQDTLLPLREPAPESAYGAPVTRPFGEFASLRKRNKALDGRVVEWTTEVERWRIEEMLKLKEEKERGKEREEKMKGEEETALNRDIEGLLSALASTLEYYRTTLEEREKELRAYFKVFWKVQGEVLKGGALKKAKEAEASLRLKNLDDRLCEGEKQYNYLTERFKHFQEGQQTGDRKLIEGYKLKADVSGASANLLGDLTIPYLDSRNSQWEFRGYDWVTFTETIGDVREAMEEPAAMTPGQSKIASAALRDYQNPDPANKYDTRVATPKQVEDQASSVRRKVEETYQNLKRKHESWEKEIEREEGRNNNEETRPCKRKRPTE